MTGGDWAAWATAMVAAVCAMGALFGFLLKKIENVHVSESKARHDGVNRITQDILTMDRELETLKQNTVRREDLHQAEQRWSVVAARLESRLDRVDEKLGGLAGIQATLASIEKQVSRHSGAD